MRRRIVGVLAACFVLLCGAGALAQSLGTIQGYITDETGGRLPGVTVVIRNVETGLERTVVTNEEGFYSAPRLPSGTYSVTASLEGFQTVVRENIVLLVSQVLDVNLTMGVAAVEEVVTVTAESPVIETSRSAEARYVSDEEITNLPISGRDFTNFALLAPTVKTEPVRGGISLSGQKGINSGFAIDGTEAKSAFFGYGRGGEATENDGLVVAQESVKEFQVIVSGFAPEYSRNGGGYINVITKSGTNEVKGSGFLFFRNDSLSARLLPTDLDTFRGKTGDEPEFDPTEFERYNWGASIGGPIKRDRTHYFFSYDQSARDTPFVSNIRGRGQYDAVLARFPSLLRGFVPNDDGIAAPDPELGRTASGQFTRSIDNLILFGKINHQINENHSLSVRYNVTDYERTSDLKSEESLKTEDTQSLVVSLVSILGTNAVNEFRFQYATDNLDRLSNLEEGDIVANFRIERPSFTSFGKPDFLPIFVDEEKFQFQNHFSYLFGSHDTKFGVDLNIDNLSEFFAGSFDGRYDFRTIEDFLANNARRVRIWFADIAPPPAPNFDVTQQTLGLYAQDTWKVNERVTLNYGARWDATFNPDGLEHALPEGREIPDDLDNFAPRLGVTFSPDAEGKSVIRAGVGRFFARTPTLIFFNVVQDNGIFPNFGRVVVSPGQPGFVPLGEPIDHTNPPPGLVPALGIVDPSFGDPGTWRVNAGYERELAPDWAAQFDFTYATSDNQQSNIDRNVLPPTRDEFGRPVYERTRPDPNFGPIMTRVDISRSNYVAGTFGVSKRFSRGYQFQAHYTVSRDKDNDSNERSATSITLTDFTDPDYDYGLSERDILHRFVASGIAALPGGVKLSGIVTVQSGAVFTALDPNTRITNHPTTTLRARAVVDGRLTERNAFRGPSLKNVDIRVSKVFDLGRAQVEAIAEVFNLFNWGNFIVTGATQDFYLDDGVTPNPEFGIAGGRPDGPTFGNQRQAQFGLRILY